MLRCAYDRLRTFSFCALSVLGIAVLAVSLAACGGSEPTCCDGPDIPEPEWFMNPPEDPHYVYGVQSATADGAKKALDMATNNARGELASQLEARIEEYDEDVAQEGECGDRENA